LLQAPTQLLQWISGDRRFDDEGTARGCGEAASPSQQRDCLSARNADRSSYINANRGLIATAQ